MGLNLPALFLFFIRERTRASLWSFYSMYYTLVYIFISNDALPYFGHSTSRNHRWDNVDAQTEKKEKTNFKFVIISWCFTTFFHSIGTKCKCQMCDTASCLRCECIVCNGRTGILYRENYVHVLYVDHHHHHPYAWGHWVKYNFLYSTFQKPSSTWCIYLCINKLDAGIKTRYSRRYR